MLTAEEILHHVTNLINDSEALLDTRRLHTQQQHAALTARLPSQRPPSRSSSNRSRDRHDRQDRNDRWPQSVVPVDAVSASSRVSRGPTYEWDPYEWELEQDRLKIAAVKDDRAARGGRAAQRGAGIAGSRGTLPGRAPRRDASSATTTVTPPLSAPPTPE